MISANDHNANVLRFLESVKRADPGKLKDIEALYPVLTRKDFAAIKHLETSWEAMQERDERDNG